MPDHAPRRTAAPHTPRHGVIFDNRPAVTLQQAVAQAPTLAGLMQMAAASRARLAIIRPLLPPALRPLVKAGDPSAENWGLLAPHNAAAAKLRQLAPMMMHALAQAGQPVAAIRIRVQQPGN